MDLKKILLFCLATLSLSVFAGERTIVLNCLGEISQSDGEYYYGGHDEIRVILSTENDPQVYVETQVGAPGAEVKAVKAEAKGDYNNFFQTKENKRIYLFKSSNCISKNSISAVLMFGNETVASCSTVLKDVMKGSDFDFCN